MHQNPNIRNLFTIAPLSRQEQLLYVGSEFLTKMFDIKVKEAESRKQRWKCSMNYRVLYLCFCLYSVQEIVSYYSSVGVHER